MTAALVAATVASVLLIDVAQGETCCWCNCPATAADSDICGGCTEPADAVLRVIPEPEIGDNWPVCRAHREDAVVVLQIYLVNTAQSP